MARIIRSAKTLLSPTSETPTSPITADLVRPTPSPLPSDLAVPSLGHDGVYGYDLKGKKAASPLHVPVPTENTGKFIPLMKKLSRDSSKSKKSSLELSPQTLIQRNRYRLPPLPHLRDKDAAFLHADFREFHAPGADVNKAIAAEVYQSKTVIDACVASGIKHVVYSALEDFPEDKRVAHCSAKAEVVKYIKSTSLPTTYLYTCTPFSDVLHHLSKSSDEDYLLSFPITDETAMPGFPVEQTGEWVKVAIAKPDKWVGQDMHACTERPTPTQIAATLSKISKKHVDTSHLSTEHFYSEAHQVGVGLNWAHYRSYMEGLAERDVKLSEHVVPHQWSFKQWASQSQELKTILA